MHQINIRYTCSLLSYSLHLPPLLISLFHHPFLELCSRQITTFHIILAVCPCSLRSILSSSLLHRKVLFFGLHGHLGGHVAYEVTGEEVAVGAGVVAVVVDKGAL